MITKKKNFLIAEAGINHNGNLKKAIKLIDAAKKSGVDSIKFQTYITEKRVPRNHKAFDILKKCELKFNDFKILKDYCDQKKIIFFSTPFDKESVNFLDEIKVKLFKISSFDTENYDLINEILKKKKFTIISSGMSKLSSIKKINKIFNKKKVKHSILHCISSYPQKDSESYLKNINYLKNSLNCSIGLSDHTPGIKTSIYAYLLGAKIIEKHFKLSKLDNCVDSAVSITPEQMLELKNELRKIEEIIGKVKFGVRPNEKNAVSFKRKKIYA